MKVKLKKLKDQVIVLTGASSGIGLTMARMAARRGARLVLSARNGEALRRVALRMELEEEGAPISVTLVKPSSIDTPYRQHARNHMDLEPLNPPPVYAPETVAEAILHSTSHPERDVFVGGGGKFLSVAGERAPRLTDRAMEAFIFDLQRSDRPRPANRKDSLYDPSGDGEERGGYPGYVAESSLYTKASLHPWLACMAVLGAGLALAALFRPDGSGGGRNGRRPGSANRPGLSLPVK